MFIWLAASSLARQIALHGPPPSRLAVGGEFAFVLLTAAQSARLISSGKAKYYSLAVALTMVLAPLLWMVNDRFIARWFAG